MIRAIRPLGTALMISSVTVALLAQGPTPKLNIKMGLWEITTSTTMTGDMPVDTSKMTPQQQEAMKSAMAGMMAPKTTVTPTCMTKEKFQQGMLGAHQDNCKVTMPTDTPGALDIQASCDDGKTKSVVMTHIEAVSTVAVKGSVKTTATSSGKTMNMSGTMTGKWTAADCGTVK